MGFSRFSLVFLEEKDSIKDIQIVNGIVASPTQSQSLRVAALKKNYCFLPISEQRILHIGCWSPP